jgi:predicted component of type VI protein secretion system
MNILELTKKYDISPLNLLRTIFKNKYNNDIISLYKNPKLLDDNDKEQLNIAIANDIYALINQDTIQNDAILFENNIQQNLITAQDYVRSVIEQFEPRVQLASVRVESPERDPHTVYVTIVYRTLNNSEPQTLTLLFKRVR